MLKNELLQLNWLKISGLKVKKKSYDHQKYIWTISLEKNQLLAKYWPHKEKDEF